MTEWTVEVEWRPAAEATDEDALDLLDELKAQLLRWWDGGDVTGDGTVVARVHVTAPNVRGALDIAVGRVEPVSGQPVTGARTLTTEEHDRQRLRPRLPDLVDQAGIADLTGVPVERIQALAESDGFPAAVLTTSAGPLFAQLAVNHWIITTDPNTGLPRPRRDEEPSADSPDTELDQMDPSWWPTPND